MTLTQRLTELRPRVRWRVGRVATDLLHRRSFVVANVVAPGQTVVGVLARPVGA